MCPILFQALEITNKQKVLSRADVLGLQSLLSPLGLPSSPLARLWFLVPSSACPATRPSPTHPCMPRPPHCCGLFLMASHLGPQLPPLCYPFPGTPDLSPLLSPRSCYFSPQPPPHSQPIIYYPEAERCCCQQVGLIAYPTAMPTFFIKPHFLELNIESPAPFLRRAI